MNQEVKYGIFPSQSTSAVVKSILCFLFYAFPDVAFASGEPFPIGARSWGMGNATVAMGDYQSVFNNPAGVGFLKHNFISTSYHARYTISGLQTFSLSGNYNTKLCNLGLTAERFGDKLYNEQKLGLVLAKSTNRVALGIKVSYLQAAIENFTAKHSILTEFGVMAKLSSKFQIGFHAYNLTGAKLFASQRVPAVLRLGLAFMPTKQLLLTVEAEKDLDFSIIMKAGLEYQIVKNFYLRTGITSKLSNAHFGLGFQAKQFLFDYAASNHAALGFSHHLGVTYQLSKNKNLHQ